VQERRERDTQGGQEREQARVQRGEAWPEALARGLTVGQARVQWSEALAREQTRGHAVGLAVGQVIRHAAEQP